MDNKRIIYSTRENIKSTLVIFLKYKKVRTLLSQNTHRRIKKNVMIPGSKVKSRSCLHDNTFDFTTRTNMRK